LSSTVSKLNRVEIEISVTVSADDVAAALNGALNRLAKEAHVRGFRKGKAPLGVVKRLYGKAVLDDLRAELVSQHYVAALTEHGIDPVSEPSLVNTGELAEGAPFTCTLRVEVAPTLEQLAVDGIELERRRIAVAPEEIDGELKRIQSSLAKTAPLSEPRPARAGDAVRVELKRWRDGAWQEPPMAPQEIVLDEEALRPELFTAMVGASAGDEREVVFAPEGDEVEAEAVKFLGKVLEVKERALPAIDDELAKDVGELETLDALKADIAKRLGEAREREEEKRLRHEMFDKLREKNPLELPPRIVEQQARMMADQLLGMMGRGSGEAGLDDEATEKLMESSKTAARDIVHQHFLTKEIARLGALAATDADVEEELGKMAQATGLPLPRIKARMAEESRLVELRASILERKVFDFVKPQVKITEVDAPAREQGGGDR
jgi:trigger factor